MRRSVLMVGLLLMAWVPGCLISEQAASLVDNSTTTYSPPPPAASESPAPQPSGGDPASQVPPPSARPSSPSEVDQGTEIVITAQASSYYLFTALYAGRPAAAATRSAPWKARALTVTFLGEAYAAIDFPATILPEDVAAGIPLNLSAPAPSNAIYAEAVVTFFGPSGLTYELSRTFTLRPPLPR